MASYPSAGLDIGSLALLIIPRLSILGPLTPPPLLSLYHQDEEESVDVRPGVSWGPTNVTTITMEEGEQNGLSLWRKRGSQRGSGRKAAQGSAYKAGMWAAWVAWGTGDKAAADRGTGEEEGRGGEGGEKPRPLSQSERTAGKGRARRESEGSVGKGEEEGRGRERRGSQGSSVDWEDEELIADEVVDKIEHAKKAAAYQTEFLQVGGPWDDGCVCICIYRERDVCVCIYRDSPNNTTAKPTRKLTPLPLLCGPEIRLVAAGVAAGAVHPDQRHPIDAGHRLAPRHPAPRAHLQGRPPPQLRRHTREW